MRRSDRHHRWAAVRQGALRGVFLFSCIISWSSNAHALRCGNDLVTVGDTKFTVIKKCGEPSSRQRWEEEIVDRLSDTRKQSITSNIEEWIYDFGPNRFLQVLRFRNSTLLSIEERGYGFLESETGASCEDRNLKIGDTKYEVQRKCGKPAFEDAWEEEALEKIDDLTRIKVWIIVDEWTFNFGPNRFTKIITFRNGRLWSVRKGDRGF